MSVSGPADSEHEQILVRVGIGVAIVAGPVIASIGDSAPRPGLPAIVDRDLLSWVAAAACSSPGRPDAGPVRRYLGMAIDMLASPLVSLVGTRHGRAPLYPFYLWIMLAWVSLRAGYLLVSAVREPVQLRPGHCDDGGLAQAAALAGGMWVALLVPPAYALSLLTKLPTLSPARRRPTGPRIGFSPPSATSRAHRCMRSSAWRTARGSRLRAEQRNMVRTVRSAGLTLLEMIGDL